MRDRPFEVLLVGASGVFGSRLARLLANEADVALTLAGRRREPLETLARTIEGGVVRTLDRDSVEPRDLTGVDLVIDCAGPFQSSGDRLVRAAIAAGVDYADLADGHDWVARFAERYGSAAESAGVRAITGVSSIPALSHAVLDRMTAGWRAIDTISVGIFPGNRAPRGLSVVEAILSYCGKPVRVFEHGGWRTEYGWGQLHRVDCGAAGWRWASLCDTPEQDLLVERYAPRRAARFHAGMELTLLHVGLWLLCWPVRWGLLNSLRPFARPLLMIARLLLPFGSDRGAMIIEANGEGRDGARVHRRWTLDAKANLGPLVPIVPALALVRKLRDNSPSSAPGARHAGGLLDYRDLANILASLGIAVAFAE